MIRVRWWEGLVVSALVFALALQLVMALRSDGLTNDEVLYIAAGYRHLTAADYREFQAVEGSIFSSERSFTTADQIRFAATPAPARRSAATSAAD